MLRESSHYLVLDIRECTGDMASELLANDGNVVRVLVERVSKHVLGANELERLVLSIYQPIGIEEAHLSYSFQKRHLVVRKPLQFVYQLGSGHDDDPSLRCGYLEHAALVLQESNFSV